VLSSAQAECREEGRVNQQELVDAVAQAMGSSKGKAAKAVSATLDMIRDSLKRGEKVAISGFGVFEAVRREAREGHNPQTGEPVQIAASTTVKFRPGKGLKDAVNGGG
jgi:DNA-binding protein HU-beta